MSAAIVGRCSRPPVRFVSLVATAVGLEARPWALVVKHAIEWLNPSGRVSRKAGRQRDDVVRGEAPSGAGEPIDKLLS